MTDARGFQKGLALLVPAILFGFLVATQWHTFAAPNVAIRYVDPLTETVGGLQDEQAVLKSELGVIRGRLDELQRASASQSDAVKELQARIDDLKVSAGLAEARGEGVVVTLNATRAPVGVPAETTCFAPDLTDLVNAAWRGGARAVVINGERLVASSSVYCVGGTIVVNGSITSAPFEVSAVGPSGAILAVLDDPAQLRDLKARRDQQAIELTFTRATALVLPAYTGPLSVEEAAAR